MKKSQICDLVSESRLYFQQEGQKFVTFPKYDPNSVTVFLHLCKFAPPGIKYEIICSKLPKCWIILTFCWSFFLHFFKQNDKMQKIFRHFGKPCISEKDLLLQTLLHPSCKKWRAAKARLLSQKKVTLSSMHLHVWCQGGYQIRKPSDSPWQHHRTRQSALP